MKCKYSKQLFCQKYQETCFSLNILILLKNCLLIFEYFLGNETVMLFRTLVIDGTTTIRNTLKMFYILLHKTYLWI